MHNLIRCLLWSLIVLTVAVRLWLLPRQQFHCDEFFFLSRIHEFHRGELSDPIQTLAVRAFEWLTMLPGAEVTQLLVGRGVMLVCSACIIYGVYRLARLFYGEAEATFAAFCYATASYVIEHGAAFRLDPVCGVGYLLLLFLGFSGNLILAGLGWGVLVIYSLKTILFLPTFLLLLIWNGFEGNKLIKPLFTVGSAAIVGAACTLFFHSSTLPVQAELALAPKLEQVAGGFLGFGMTRYVFQDFILFVVENPLLVALQLLGIYLVVRVIVLRHEMSRQHLGLCCLLPALLILVCYRNAFSYFYPLLLIPMVVVAAESFKRLLQTHHGGARIAAVFLVGSIAYQSTTHVLQLRQESNEPQRALIRRIHELYPEPVAYIDRCGMMASFKKVGLFMSTYVMERYRAQETPFYRELIDRFRPRFVLDCPAFVDWDRGGEMVDQRYRLLPADERAIRQNFVPSESCIYSNNFIVD